MWREEVGSIKHKTLMIRGNDKDEAGEAVRRRGQVPPGGSKPVGQCVQSATLNTAPKDVQIVFCTPRKGMLYSALV